MANLVERRWFRSLGLFALAGLVGCGDDTTGAEQEVVESTAQPLLTCTQCSANDPVVVDACCTCQLTGVCTYTLPLFQGSTPTDLAVATSVILSLNDRVNVTESSPISVGAMLSNIGSGGFSGTALGVTSSSGTILSKSQVTLRDRAHVKGNIYSSVSPLSHQNTFTIDGVTELGVAGFATDTTWARTVTFPGTIGGPVNLDSGGTPTVFTLTPGGYQSVTVKSGRTLVVQTGDYFLGSLDIEAGAILRVSAGSGPVRVFMKGNLIYRGQQSGGTATPPLSFPSLTIYTDDTSTQIITPGTATPTFAGVVIAPNATINAGLATYTGALFGRTVTVFEGATLRHVQEPFSFRGFGAVDRVSVTGGNIRKNAEITDEEGQAESAVAISRNGTNFTVTVTSNDTTTIDSATVPPRFEYLINIVEGQPPVSHRKIYDGASMMGWSFSTNGGFTFQYGGHTFPPSGWSVLYGDPVMAKPSIDDPYDFIAEEGTSTTVFRNTPGFDSTGNFVLDTTPIPDGHCVSRSTDRGVTFPTIACVTDGQFHDGTALAATFGSGNRRQVYLGSGGGSVATGVFWRMDGETMAFTSLPDPFLGTSLADHPRLRVSGGTLYVAATAGSSLQLNQLAAASSSTTWGTPVSLGVFPSNAAGPLPDGTALLTANDYSFDVGQNRTGQTVVRVVYTTSFGGSGPSVKTIECQANLTNCVDGRWTAFNSNVAPFEPNLRFGGGVWMATWKVYDKTTKLISVVAAALRDDGTNRTFDQRTVAFPQNPCHSTHTFGGDYWGDYDEMDSFQDGRFFTGYTLNGPGCRFMDKFTADMHVGGAVINF